MNHVIYLGDNKVVNCEAALVVRGTEVFRLREHGGVRGGKTIMVVDFDLRDSKGERIAKVAKNSVVYCADGYKANQEDRSFAIVRDADGNVMAAARILPDGAVQVIGEFWVDGFCVLITPKMLKAGGMMMSGNVISGFGKAINFGDNSASVGSR